MVPQHALMHLHMSYITWLFDVRVFRVYKCFVHHNSCFVKAVNKYTDSSSQPWRNVARMENVTTRSAAATDVKSTTSQGQARLTENISPISLSHLHHQISVKLNHFPLKGQTSVTHSRGGDSGLYSFTSKWGRKSNEGPKVLIQQSYFMGDAAILPSLLCLWSWFEVMLGPFDKRLGCTNLPPGEGRETGGSGGWFNCQVTWCRDRRSFGRIVCLCMEGQPSEIPHLIKRKPRLIDKFSNWRPEDGTKSAQRPAN